MLSFLPVHGMHGFTLVYTYSLSGLRDHGGAEPKALLFTKWLLGVPSMKPLGAKNGCSGMPSKPLGAQKHCSGVPLKPLGAQNACSGMPSKPLGTQKQCSGMPLQATWRCPKPAHRHSDSAVRSQSRFKFTVRNLRSCCSHSHIHSL